MGQRARGQSVMVRLKGRAEGTKRLRTLEQGYRERLRFLGQAQSEQRQAQRRARGGRSPAAVAQHRGARGGRGDRPARSQQLRGDLRPPRER